MLIAFVPVLHKGYIDLFKKYPDTLGILGADVIADFTALTRDCRVVDPEVMKLAIETLGIFSSVRVLSKADFASVARGPVASDPVGAQTDGAVLCANGGLPRRHPMLPSLGVTPNVAPSDDSSRFIMPDDEVSHALVEQYSIPNVAFESIFLRWDKMQTLRENVVAPHRKITSDAFAQSIMGAAITESLKSSDWWRQVGTVIAKDGTVIARSHNKHLPTDYHLDVEGDPRTNFDAGVRIDLTTAIHSEALAIAQSANAGISLNGADAYVTTFPCPNCARLLAESGIKTVYYHKGYSLLDAEDILKAYGIEIILVDLANTSP